MQIHDLFEDANQDIDTRLFVTKIARKIIRTLYTGVNADYEVPYKGEDLIGYDPKTLGISDALPGMMICLGMGDKVSEGQYRRYNSGNHITHLIVINCLKDNSPQSIRAAVSSQAFYETLKHELIHAFDYQRTNDRIWSGKNDDLENRSDSADQEYYNSAAEYNAHFHNVASSLIEMLAELNSCSSPKQASVIVGEFGFTGTWKHDFRSIMQKAAKENPGFIAWLSDNSQKRLVRRLYLLHQKVVSRISELYV